MPNNTRFRDVVRYNTDVAPGTTSEANLLGRAAAAQIVVNVVRQPGDRDPIDNQLQRTLFKIENGDAAAPPAAGGVIGQQQQTIRDVWGQIKKDYFQASGGAIILPGVELSPGPEALSATAISAFGTGILSQSWTQAQVSPGITGSNVAFRAYPSVEPYGIPSGTFGIVTGTSNFLAAPGSTTFAAYAQQTVASSNFVVMRVINGYSSVDVPVGHVDYRPPDAADLVMDLSAWTWTGSPALPAAIAVGGSGAQEIRVPWGCTDFYYIETNGFLYLASREVNGNVPVAAVPRRPFAQAYTAAHGGGVPAP